MLPLEIVLVPTYLVVRGLGLVNGYGGLILPLAVDAFGIFLMRQYIKDLPDSLIEAARLDGFSERGIFWRVILPNCKPALGALALLTFRDNWDQFLWPLIVAAGHAQDVSAGGWRRWRALTPRRITRSWRSRGIALSGLKE
jgi:multiple sugar transport system permease protein